MFEAEASTPGGLPLRRSPRKLKRPANPVARALLRVDDDGNDWAGREATESFSAAPSAPWGQRSFLGAGGCSNEWVDAALAVDDGVEFERKRLSAPPPVSR